jgi:hypothetical protein
MKRTIRSGIRRILFPLFWWVIYKKQLIYYKEFGCASCAVYKYDICNSSSYCPCEIDAHLVRKHWFIPRIYTLYKSRKFYRGCETTLTPCGGCNLKQTDACETCDLIN